MVARATIAARRPQLAPAHGRGGGERRRARRRGRDRRQAPWASPRRSSRTSPSARRRVRVVLRGLRARRARRRRQDRRADRALRPQDDPAPPGRRGVALRGVHRRRARARSPSSTGRSCAPSATPPSPRRSAARAASPSTTTAPTTRSAVRGLGQPGDYGNRVLILSDGASLNDNLLDSSYIGSDGRDDLHDVSRIEVVRGPGSLLYGTGAFSGLVNLVPREKDEPEQRPRRHRHLRQRASPAAASASTTTSRPKIGIWASVTGARSDGVDVPVTLNSPARRARPRCRRRTTSTTSAPGAPPGRFWADAFTAQWFFHTREQHLPAGVNGAVFNDLAPGVRRHALARRAALRAQARRPGRALHPRPRQPLHVPRRVPVRRRRPSTPNVEDYYGTWGGIEARVAYSPIKAIRITVGGEGQYHPQVEMYGHVGSAARATTGHVRTSTRRTPYGFGAGYLLFEGSPASWFRISAGARVDDYPPPSAPSPSPARRSSSSRGPGGVLKLMCGRAFRAPSVYEEFYNDGGQTTAPGNDASAAQARPRVDLLGRDRVLAALQGGLGGPRSPATRATCRT